MNPRINQKLKNLEKALTRFEMALKTPLDNNHLLVEATIQCFEFSYELTWKILKALLENEGLPATTPRQIFQEAYQAGWISDQSVWLNMLKDRNLTSHTYNEKIALEIYERSSDYYVAMQEVFNWLHKKIQ